MAMEKIMHADRGEIRVWDMSVLMKICVVTLSLA